MSRFKLPLYSGLLLALCFFPFYFWPLVFVALAPLFYFVRTAGARDAFWGGCIAGALGTAPTLYFTLAQLNLFPDALLFTYVIRASSLPAFMLIAFGFGCMTYLFSYLRPGSALQASATGAALYIGVEATLFAVIGGYYYPALSHAVAVLPFARLLAAFGGTLFVSFWIVWTNVLLAELWRTPRRALTAVLVSVVFFGACAGAAWQRGQAAVSSGVLSVALLQTGGSPLEGVVERGVFESAELAARLKAAEASFVVYPYSPLLRALSPAEVRAMGEWLALAAPASSTVLVWNTQTQVGALFDQFDVWSGGAREQYQKHRLYALSDYAPAWAARLGLVKNPTPITAGTSSTTFTVDGTAMGGLICSELHQQEYARVQAAFSDVLVAVGWDAMFPGDLAGNFSLAAAQYRAAENGVPLVRGNITGPSALIHADGAVSARLGFGEGGVLKGGLLLEKVPTYFAWWGGWPLLVLCLCALGLNFLERRSDIDGRFD